MMKMIEDKPTTLSYQHTATGADLPNSVNWSENTNGSGVSQHNSVLHTSIMFTTGVLSNILALVVLATSRQEKKRTLFYKLVASLVVTDLLGTVATSPLVIAAYANNMAWVGGNDTCEYFSFMMILAGLATMFIVCTMALERYVCINHPYFYYTHLTTAYVRAVLALSWFGALVIATMPFFGFGISKKMFPNTWCFFDYYDQKPVNRAFNYLYSVLGMSIIMIIIIVNISVMATLIKIRCNQTVLSSGDGKLRRMRSTKRYTEIQMVVQLIGITCIFTTCYLPLMVRIFINQVNPEKRRKDLDLLVIRLASLNQILDPWVYILFRRQIVWRTVRIIKWFFGAEQSPARRRSSRDSVKLRKDSVDRKNSVNSLNFRNQREDGSCSEFCWNCLCESPTPLDRQLGSSKNSLYNTSQLHKIRSIPLTNGSTSRDVRTFKYLRVSTNGSLTICPVASV